MPLATEPPDSNVGYCNDTEQTVMRLAIYAVAFFALPAISLAQGGPVVNVTFGRAVQARSNDLGSAALEAQRSDLQREVRQALARYANDVLRVDLAIVDLQPNRPTSAQLGRSAQLSAGNSFGLGGAAITGAVTKVDGTVAPIRFRYFPTSLRDELANDDWADADEAYEELAHDLSKGRAPNQQGYWPSPHGPEVLTGSRLPG